MVKCESRRGMFRFLKVGHTLMLLLAPVDMVYFVDLYDFQN